MKVLIAAGYLVSFALIVFAAIAMEQSYQETHPQHHANRVERFMYVYDCVQRERVDLGFAGMELHFELDEAQIQYLKDCVAREFGSWEEYENALRESACERERL